jgi:hypothetical protein
MVRPSNRQIRMTGETINISSNGVLFQAEGGVEEGESIEYYITLPTSPSPTERLRLHCVGKVVRVSENADESPGARFTMAATMERYEFTRQRMAASSPLSR